MVNGFSRYRRVAVKAAAERPSPSASYCGQPHAVLLARNISCTTLPARTLEYADNLAGATRMLVNDNCGKDGDQVIWKFEAAW